MFENDNAKGTLSIRSAILVEINILVKEGQKPTKHADCELRRIKQT